VLRAFFSGVAVAVALFCVRWSLVAMELEEGFLLAEEGRASLDDRPRVLMLGVFLEPGTRAGMKVVLDEATGTGVVVFTEKLSRRGLVGEMVSSSGTSPRLRSALLMLLETLFRKCICTNLDNKQMQITRPPFHLEPSAVCLPPQILSLSLDISEGSVGPTRYFQHSGLLLRGLDVVPYHRCRDPRISRCYLGALGISMLWSVRNDDDIDSRRRSSEHLGTQQFIRAIS